MRRSFKKLNYEKVSIEGYEINFAKTTSATMSITVNQNNQIYFVAPRFMFDFQIKHYFKSKIPWIEKCIKSNKEKLKGDIILIKDNFKLKAKEERELLKKINAYVAHYEKLMGTKISSVKLRKMRSYGICHIREKSIVFSKALYFLPDEFVESVVVHEIAHVFVPNHSKRFYDKVIKYYPNYRKIWRKYKKIIVFENG